MNKNCDTELALARIADVPLRDLWTVRRGYGTSFSGGYGYGYGGLRGGCGYGYDNGKGYGYGDFGDFGHGNRNGHNGDGVSAPHET